MISELHAQIRKENEVQRASHKKKKNYSPTDADKCPRALWYTWRDFPKIDYTDKELKVFAIGNLIHEYLQKLLSDSGKQLCSEYRVETAWHGLPVAGYVDSIVLTSEGLKVVDFKTVKASGIKYVKHEPKKAHVKQVNLYLELLGLKKGQILYWSKSDGEMISHEVTRDVNVISEILDLFKEVQEALDNNELPRASFNKADWKCNWCKFSEYCKVDKNDKRGLKRKRN